MPRPRRVAFMLDLQWSYKRHASIFAGTQQYAREQNWESIVDEFAEDTLSAHSTKAVPYDGVIARASRKLMHRATRLKVPLVNVWFSSPVWNLVPGVYADCQAMGRLRAEHLLARGLRRFAGLIFENDRGMAVEMGAFKTALAEAGCSCHVAKVSLKPTSSLKLWRKTERTIESWMDDWKLPMGVFVGGDSEGRIVAQMCRNRGWRVPEDVAIIAGHNEETFCEGSRPTLTSVEVGYGRIGYQAARLLDQLMNGAAPPKTPLLLPPVNVVVRESTDFFAVDDTLVAAALQFIAAKSHQDIGPDDVARAVAAGTRTLQRRFHKHLTHSIATEIRRVRIERAKRELAQSNRSLKEIARNVGFGEAIRMYEVFCRELGVSPSKYRHQRQIAQTI